MITNERQYKISRRQLATLRKAINAFDSDEVAARVGSEALAIAELQALQSEEETLAAQLKEYDHLRSGVVEQLEAPSLSDLPQMLIRARIAQRLSQRDLADLVGLKQQQIQRYEADAYSGASLRRLGEIAAALRLSITEVAQIAREPEAVEARKPGALEWRRFPVREMYRRGWFEGFQGSLDAAEREAETLVANFVKSVITKPSAALHRRRVRSGSAIDQYALLAWECRALSLAERMQPKTAYRDELLSAEWVAGLRKLSSRPDGPRRAKGALQEIGLPLVIEPHLANTHLDGAALSLGDAPVIGMTLRYDRLDNFWFVLFHELFHVMRHLRKGHLESIFDDMDAADTEQIEAEADELAGEALIPASAWNVSLARYVRSPQSVVTSASALEISPAIVAGRIRREANNYVILNDLVGLGKVRKQFPEAEFGS